MERWKSTVARAALPRECIPAVRAITNYQYRGLFSYFGLAPVSILHDFGADGERRMRAGRGSVHRMMKGAKKERMSQTVLVASSDEHFRESVRDSLANVPNARIIAEYPEVASNLYIRVIQDLERHPEAGLIFDLASDPENGEDAGKIKQAVPDLYVIASNYHAEGEVVIAASRGGERFSDAAAGGWNSKTPWGRFEHAPARARHTQSRLGKVWTFLGVKGGVGTTTMAVNFASVLSQRKHSTVLLDLIGPYDCASQLGIQPHIPSSKSAKTWSAWIRRYLKDMFLAIQWGSSLSGRPIRWRRKGISASRCSATSRISSWRSTSTW
jgi:hypothetical protein